MFSSRRSTISLQGCSYLINKLPSISSSSCFESRKRSKYTNLQELISSIVPLVDDLFSVNSYTLWVPSVLILNSHIMGTRCCPVMGTMRKHWLTSNLVSSLSMAVRHSSSFHASGKVRGTRESADTATKILCARSAQCRSLSGLSRLYQ